MNRIITTIKDSPGVAATLIAINDRTNQTLMVISFSTSILRAFKFNFEFY